MITELTAPGVAKVVEYNRTEAALADLRKRFGNVAFDVRTTAGDKEARTARAEIKGYRTALETMRVDLKAPLLDRQRLIDTEAKRITAELLALEEPIDAQIKGEEKRKADEKSAKVEADKKRVAAIHAKLDELRSVPVGLVDATPEQLANAIADLDAFEATGDEFAEFVNDAHLTRIDVIAKLKTMHESAVRRAEEAAQLALERAELERLRAEQAERDRIAAEAREAEEARRREAQRKADEAMRAEREAHEARMAAERAELQRQQDEAAAEQRRRQKVIDDEQAAARAELQRQQDELAAQRRKAADEAAQKQRDADLAAAAALRQKAAREAAERAAREAADTAIRNAAPIMLDALEYFVDAIKRDDQGALSTSFILARDAIALARQSEAQREAA